jgi:hypothetical protein
MTVAVNTLRPDTASHLEQPDAVLSRFRLYHVLWLEGFGDRADRDRRRSGSCVPGAGARIPSMRLSISQRNVNAPLAAIGQCCDELFAQQPTVVAHTRPCGTA